MSQSRNRWLISIFLVLAIVGFVGFSLSPLLSAAFNQQNQTLPVASSVPGQNSNSGIDKLQQQAQGYEIVLQREPDNQVALQHLVQTRLQLQDYKGAISPMQKLVALNPNQTEYKLLLAQIQLHAGDSTGAIEVYRNILATKPGDLDALRGAVGLLLQQNRPEAAMNLLQDTLKAAEAKPASGSVDVAAVQLMLAQVNVLEKHYDAATDLYDQLIKEHPQDFRPVLGKAVLLKQQGKNEQAKSLFNQAVALAPEQLQAQISSLAAKELPPTEVAPTQQSKAGEVPKSK